MPGGAIKLKVKLVGGGCAHGTKTVQKTRTKEERTRRDKRCPVVYAPLLSSSFAPKVFAELQGGTSVAPSFLPPTTGVSPRATKAGQKARSVCSFRRRSPHCRRPSKSRHGGHRRSLRSHNPEGHLWTLGCLVKAAKSGTNSQYCYETTGINSNFMPQPTILECKVKRGTLNIINVAIHAKWCIRDGCISSLYHQISHV